MQPKLLRTLLDKFADILNEDRILESEPQWVGEVQIREDHLMFLVDSDYDEPVWVKLTLS